MLIQHTSVLFWFLLGTLQSVHRSLEVALVSEDLAVFEHRVGNEVGVGFELAGKGDDLLETLLGLQRGLHLLQADPEQKVHEADVFIVILGFCRRRSLKMNEIPPLIYLH